MKANLCVNASDGPIAIECITYLTFMASHECHAGRDLILEGINQENVCKKQFNKTQK